VCARVPFVYEQPVSRLPARANPPIQFRSPQAPRRREIRSAHRTPPRYRDDQTGCRQQFYQYLVGGGGGRVLAALCVEYLFTYSCDAATRIRITFSARLTLYMTETRTYSRCVYLKNKRNLNRIPYFILRSAYSTCRFAATKSAV